jgi:hypothetical protein
MQIRSFGGPVTVDGRSLCSDGKTYDLPKSLLLTEHNHNLGMIAKGDPDVRKPQMANLCYADHLVNSDNIRANPEYLQGPL